MADMEKVIKETEDGIAFAESRGFGGLANTMRDALAMLKEQEAKPMIENEIGWYCPSCGLDLIGKTASGYPCDLIDLPEDEPIHFCPRCGQAVKWE